MAFTDLPALRRHQLLLSLFTGILYHALRVGRTAVWLSHVFDPHRMVRPGDGGRLAAARLFQPVPAAIAPETQD